MTQWVSRLPLPINPLIAAAKRRTRQRRMTVVVVVLAAAAGGAVGAKFALGLSESRTPPAMSFAGCGSSVSGPGFRVFQCGSGGAAAGQPHPKELLVVRKNGTSAAYPEWGGQGVAAADGEVVAFHDLSVVRVTGSRMVALVTPAELARVLHVRPTAIIWPMSDLRVDARGDVYFAPSVQTDSGCRNPLVERTTGGELRQVRASITRSNICQ